ncbi:hypothetical protein [Streptomyces sp. ST2-7A]|uniref:hypothetical protein n=1 Tax=Streptomyces sp. ST2-7A TaxID=2907214 RepID=UPI001F316F8D|nr:hypothetical protein [Streptomyces sp. ST2-7A]MCE7080428.1 hypothetical protein [Streptomyces sp. ST2-7A]
MVGRHGAAAEKIQEAELVRDELATALEKAGVRLPSLGLDIPSCTSPVPLALIGLGRCNVETARRLTAAVRLGVEQGKEEG